MQSTGYSHDSSFSVASGLKLIAVESVHPYTRPPNSPTTALSLIQSNTCDTLAHTPGYNTSAQPFPQLVAPMSNHLELSELLTTKGPPESP